MFTPKQKRIYKWNDGIKDRRADPLAIETAMVRALGASYRDLHEPMIRYYRFRERRAEIGAAVHDGMCLDSLEAQVKYVAAVRVAFKLGDPCDPADDDKPSLDADQCMDLMSDYFDFLRGLEESARPLPESPPNLDSAAINSPTESSSASTVTGTPTLFGVPLPSPSA